MIIFDRVTITYPGATQPALSDVSLHIPEGEMSLVIGPTGSGKSTLLGAMNGLVPHFTGGTLSGSVVVAGRDTAMHPPRDLADVVGVVRQDPMASFVTDTVEEELAYTMESLGIPPATMRQRVEETLDLLALEHLRDRALLTLSAGERQRVAIGAVLTAHPRLLVLDEPTSALDPAAAEEVLAALQRLVHDLGMTVVLAEHRLERVLEFADSVILLPGGGRSIRMGSPADIMRDSPIAPAVIRLGRAQGWQPLPLSVRDARRQAGALRQCVIDRAQHQVPQETQAQTSPAVPADLTVDVVKMTVGYSETPVLRDIDLTVRRGEVVAIMGRNGAGKSTLLRSLAGIHRPQRGSITVSGLDPAQLRGPALTTSIGMVPQDPMDILTFDRVDKDCAQADLDTPATAGRAAALLSLLAPEIEPHQHPRDLSEGQRLALALAVVMSGVPHVVLLDEPTRGLDYAMKARLADQLRDMAAAGHSVLLATHDVELTAEVADRVIVLAQGSIVADGPVAQVVLASPVFAPTVAKVLQSPQLRDLPGFLPMTPESLSQLVGSP